MNRLKLGSFFFGLSPSMYSPIESEQGFNFKPELPTSSAYYRLLKKIRRQVGHAIRDRSADGSTCHLFDI